VVGKKRLHVLGNEHCLRPLSLNGYQYANMPMPVMDRGEHVRRYFLTIGEGLNFHTSHWHGNSIVSNGNRVDVLNVAPAQSLTADMIPDNPGSGSTTAT
jgi:hypothetical protein